MEKYFDENLWRRAVRMPGWNFKLYSEYKRLMLLAEKNPKKSVIIKNQVYDFFEDALRKGDVFLDRKGLNLDAERKGIDTAVIHQTGSIDGISWKRLSAIHLLRLYTGFAAGELKETIYSGHFRDGKQVFYTYHWLVRQNGARERLLSDNEIGWHSGDWNVNRRSIAICLDGDFIGKNPPKRMLESTAEILRYRYFQIKKERVFGHCEVNEKTICPGSFFLADWKKDLLALL